MRAASLTAAIVVAFALLPGRAPAAAPGKIAVLELKNPAGLTRQEVVYLTDLVRGAALRLPDERFFVMTRENILEQLPPGTDLAACEGECEVETGRNVGADYVVSGEVVRFGSSLRVSMKLHDTRTGELLGTARASGAQVDALEKPVEQAGARLFARIVARAEESAAREPGFRPEALPPVPDVPVPDKVVARVDGLDDMHALDIEALEAYDAAVALDGSDAPPAEKVKRWRALAEAHPQHAQAAEERVTVWEAYLRKMEARRAWEAQRKAAMERDWKRLGRLLKLRVVPEEAKRRWASSFVEAYGRKAEENPYLSVLSPFLSGPTGAGSTLEWSTLPGGRFLRGSEDGFGDERPVHWVHVPSFQLAKTEVTVAQYRACVAAGACTPPGTGDNCNWGRSGRDEHPVNCVSWDQARNFAKWVGGRLPSEVEWEYAARSGGRDQAYPWGDEPATCERAIMNEGGWGCGRERTWPVCSKPAGSSEQGLCDLAGNVVEWVQDCYHDSYKGAPTHGGPRTSGCAGDERVLRGGHWLGNARSLRATDRVRAPRGLRFDGVGFRPARSIP